MNPDEESGWHAYPLTPTGEHGWELRFDGNIRAICTAPNGKETARHIMDAMAGTVHYECIEDPED